jgi:class 3 adenylate cyclase
VAVGGGARREERKVVTVLFADLVGFTARAESLDPEDVQGLLAPYHARLRSELERFGGTVEKFIGDAVVALFGAPVAHEDDPERAVRAALAIRDWVGEQGEELQVRIAVNTGEALVSLDARPSEGEGMAAGDVVNTAARLQSGAPVNGILVGEQTYRATAEAIAYRESEPVVGKGKSEPIAAWEALEARSRIGVDISRRADTELVGRTRELDVLVSALERVREERSPQLLTVVGVPGIGKSRLVRELFGSVERDAELVRWRQGRSLPYGEGVTFWALGEIVKAEAGILENDAPETAGEKLGRTVERVADEAEHPWLERHLRPLAGVSEVDSGGAEEGVAAWRRFLERLAEERPLVLVFEDLHWADDALLDFVDALVERVGQVPLLAIGTARPELLQRRPAWGGGKPNALTISLSPLSDEDTARLVGALLEQPLLDAGTQEALLARSGGNPLYAEQYARILLERGDLSELPETVQGIIAARLDGLSDGEKRLLQDAAVVGKVFWAGAVEAVDGVDRGQADELLHSLERKEFVQRARSSSVAGETEYAFRHLLIRDIAYGQIPRAARSDKHRRAAVWIESLGRTEDQAEMLAHHYLEALDLAEAAGLDAAALGESARHALRDAGDRAAALYAVSAAERFYDAALRLWPEDDLERGQILLRRAAPVHYWPQEDPGPLIEARDVLLAAGDRLGAAEAETLIAHCYWIQGQTEQFNEHSQRAAALVEDAPPSRARLAVLLRRASSASIEGERAAALELGGQALELAEQLGWQEGVCGALGQLGVDRVASGERGGFDDLARGIELAGSVGALSVQSRLYNTLSVAHQLSGELAAAYEARREGAELGARLGLDATVRWFEAPLTDHRYRAGEWEQASTAADEYLAVVESGSPHYGAWQVYGIRAELRLARDDLDGAVADAERALELARAADDAQSVPYVVALAAHVFAVASEDDRAAALFDELLGSMKRGSELHFGVLNLPLLASAATRLGRGGELAPALSPDVWPSWREVADAYAREDFASAAEALQAIGSVPDEAEARLFAARSFVAAGRRQEADEQLALALDFYRRVGATRWAAECEALLAASA